MPLHLRDTQSGRSEQPHAALPFVPLRKPLVLRTPRPWLEDSVFRVLGTVLTVLVWPFYATYMLGFALVSPGSAAKTVQRRPSKTAEMVARWRFAHYCSGLGQDRHAWAFLPWMQRLPAAYVGLVAYLNGGGSAFHDDLLAARTEFIDAYLEHNARTTGIREIVILGAGYDTRAYRLHLPKDCTVWELDAPTTQREKLRRLAEAGIRSEHHVRYVSVDFMEESWMSRLEEAGFNPRHRVLVVWEGVSYYLSKESVERTLDLVASLAPVSMIAFDYFTRAQVYDEYDAETLRRVSAGDLLLGKLGKRLVAGMGEPLTFGMDMDEVPRLLGSRGLQLRTHIDDKTMEDVYCTRTRDPLTGRGGGAVGHIPFFIRFCMAEVA